MKKLLSLALVLVMALTLSVNVFAGSTISGDTDGSAALTPVSDIPVTATLNLVGVEDTYRVDVAWDDLTFGFSSTTTWNVNTHKEEVTNEWNKTTGNITITNHSNVAITVGVTTQKAALLDNPELSVNVTKTTDADNDDKVAAGTVDGGDNPISDTIVYTFQIGGVLKTPGEVATVSVSLS